MADRNNRQAEVSLWGPSNKQLTSTTIGGKELLDVNATVSNDESPTKYQLLTDYDATGTSVTTTDTELFSYSGIGVVSFIAVTNATTSNWEVVINVDGTERFRITMSDLGSTLGLTDGYAPIWTQTANKQFRYHPTPEIGFTTGFSVEGRATTGSTTLSHLILYKEKVA